MNRLTYTGDARLAAVRILAAPCLDGHPAIRGVDIGGTLSIDVVDDWPWSSGEQVLIDLLVCIGTDGGGGVGALASLRSPHLDEKSREAVLDAMALLRLGPVAS